MYKTKKKVVVSIREEGGRFVSSWTIEPEHAGTAKEQGEMVLDRIHEIDRLSGIPYRDLHLEYDEITVKA